MGIPSLIPLILKNPSLLQRFELKDTKLVIDGNCLEKHFYKNTGLNKSYGGDYDRYSTKLENFFGVFREFRVVPIVVFDGGHDLDDRKLQTRLKRAQDRIENPLKSPPILVHEAFVCTLDKMGIKHVTCDFEADHEIVVLANDLECPLLSFDSDFFIYEIKKGYIPINELDLKSMAKGEKLCKLEVKVYFTKTLIEKFPYLGGKLPLLATVLGNDYIAKDSEAMKTFFKSLRVPKPDRPIFEETDSYFCAGLRKVMGWLERKTERIGLDEFMRFMDSEQRKMAKLSVDQYSNSTEYIRFNVFNFLSGSLVDNTNDQDSEMTPWLMQKHRSGEHPKFVQNTILIRRIILDCQLEDIKRKSTHECSLSLRQIIYGILVGDNGSVTEYDRVNRQVKERRVNGTLLTSGITGIVIDLCTIKDIEIDKMEILKSSIGDAVPDENIKSLNTGSVLFLMIFLYWYKKSGLALESSLVRSILLSFVILSIQKNENTTEEVIENTNSWLEPMDECPLKENISVSHSLAELQSCLKYGMFLNRLLGCPVENVDPATIYGGSLIHIISDRIEEHGFEMIKEDLKKIPKAPEYFDSILGFIENNIHK